MATRGYENFTQTDVARLSRKDPPAVKLSKYRNVKTFADGQQFDSKREADYWLLLKARQALGEIRNLRRQVTFWLRCPVDSDPALSQAVAFYVADYVYEAHDAIGNVWRTHVVDAKGTRTQMYQLKKKWLELQSGIVIQEV